MNYTDDYYKTRNGYDFSLFTKEDREMYRPVLEKEPYDWRLMKFFHEQKRAHDRYRRHTVCCMDIGRIEEYRLPADDPCPEEAYLRREREEAILRSIDELPPCQRMRTYRFLIRGMSYGEIAELEGKAYSTVFRSVQKGMEELRKKYGSMDNMK